MFDILLFLLIFVAFAIRTSWFQTWAAQQVASYLSSEWGTDVKIEKVDIVFFDRVDIEGVYVADKLNDTLLYSGLIHADIADWSLSKSFVTIDRAELNETYCYLKIYEGDSTFNFQHIVDYFHSDEPEDTSSSAFQVNINTIALNNINFIFQDQNAPEVKNGMDFSNLHFQNITGEFTDFGMLGDTIAVSMNDFHLKESQSGFMLTKLQSNILFCPEIISLQKLKLGFNNSVLLADYIELKTPKGGEEFSNFVTDVYFNAHIANSRLSLADLAFFVPDIWGMNDMVYLDNINVTGPIYGMRFKDVRIHMMDTTLITGNFQVPNLSDEAIFYDIELDTFRTSTWDIEKMNLSPFLEKGEKSLSLPDNYKKAGLIALTNGQFTGYMNDFVVDGDLETGLGHVHSEYGIHFIQNEKDKLYYYNGGDGHEHAKDLIVENVDLQALSGNSLLGVIDGYIDIDGKGFTEKELNVNFNGHLNKVGLNGYSYSNIDVRAGNFSRNVFTGIIDVQDDNLALLYNGKVDLNGAMFFDFMVQIDSAKLDELNLSSAGKHDLFKSKIQVKIKGTSLNEMYGEVYITKLHYKDTAVDFNLDTMALIINRNPKADTVHLFSPYLTVDLAGKFDLSDIYPVLQTQLSYVLGNLVEPKDIIATKNEYFDLDIRLKDINPLMPFIDKNIYIAENSRIQSYYDLKKKRFALDVNILEVNYHGMQFDEIKLENRFDSVKASLYYQVQHGKINDSIEVRNIYVDGLIRNNQMFTNFGWDGYGGTQPALFAFTTHVDETHEVLTEFNPSFFFLKDTRWTINDNSKIVWNPELIQLSKFKITNGNNAINFNGKISENPNDWLYFYVENFNLADLNGLLGGDMKLGGILNLDGGVADVYNKLRFQSMTDITNFVINDEEVGDIMVGGKYDMESNSISMLGNLKRNRSETFRFEGDYFLDKEKENINLVLTFDQTDISFLNAFEDPELYTDIEGIIDGELKVTGEITSPKIKGGLDILMAGLTVPMFNVGFGITGAIKMDDGEILATQMSVFDQEGNRAMANMQIYHDDWSNFNYDITLDMEDKKMAPRFLVMNTQYKDGDYYYGKAYITGHVNIFGYEDLTQIEVDATTEKGTSLYLPLYGSSDLEEGSLIHFTEPYDSTKTVVEQKIERLGMTLDMKFHVTKDAQVTIVFEPVYEDQIVAKGIGDIEIGMDDFGEMTMFGKYQITDGVYNMRVKTLIREDFVIDPKSTITWTRSPYDADIDIAAMFYRNLSLAEIMPNPGDRGKDNVTGYLIMRETLMKPALSFDITAPLSDQAGKDAIAALKADKDMLTKQFFAILVLQRFIPIYGSNEGGGGAIALLEDQLNTALEGISGNVAISLGEKKVLTYDKQINENITISVSGGVVDSENQTASSIVGDVKVEYKLNEDGTFTMNFFNETNSGAEAENGQFTQGVSMHYQETFNNSKDFKLLQGFLNIFRSDSNDVKLNSGDKQNKRRTPIPADSTSVTTQKP